MIEDDLLMEFAVGLPERWRGWRRHGARQYRLEGRFPEGLGITVAVFVAALSGCATSTDFALVPAAPAEGILSTVFLAGDGGHAAFGDPLIDQLRRDIQESERRTGAPVVVAFLGDNIYEEGLRPQEPELTRDTTILAAQLAVIENSTARAIFLPGNHDWDDEGPRGLEAIRAQEAFFEAAASRGVNVDWAPKAGCPGPEAIALPGLRLIALDTQWLLHEHDKGDGATCPHGEPEDVQSALTGLIDGAGSSEALVLSHHPLRTHGPHGGFFPVDRHLFPLRDLASWAFLPLPALGTAYVIARKTGVTDQDFSGADNLAMRTLVGNAFAAASRPPLFHAAGHEHSLQVLRGEPGEAGYQIVSGTASKSTPVGSGDDTLFASSAPGYIKLEVTPSTVRLTVTALASDTTEPPMGWCREIDRASRSANGCSG